MPTSGKIAYVITKGEYSDYHICAVTLDRKEAERLRKRFSYSDEYGDNAKIEEYVLNDESCNLKKKYIVEMPEGSNPILWRKRMFSLNVYESPKVKETADVPTVYVVANDDEHALKIAQDTYAEWKARNEGLV